MVLILLFQNWRQEKDREAEREEGSKKRRETQKEVDRNEEKGRKSLL